MNFRFVSAEILFKKEKLKKRTYYRKKRKMLIFTIRLDKEFVLTDDNYNPVNPKKSEIKY